MMKKGVMTLLLLTIISTLSISVVAQDLIVTYEGDSLDCNITKVEDEIFYFTYMRDGDKQKTLMRKEQVKDYHYGFYEAAEFPKPVLDNSFPRFRIGLMGGWSRMIARTSKQVPSNFKQYVKELKSGFYLGADFAYFFPSDYGVGLRHSLFITSNQMGNVEDNIKINFIGPSMYQRLVIPDQTIVFVSSFSMGMLSYNNQARLGDPIKITGTSIGLNASLGVDFMLEEHLALCLEASATLGSFGKFNMKSQGKEETVELEERENVSRIDLGIGLRFYK